MSSKLAIVAQLISTETCMGHWLITFSQSSTFSGASLEQNKLQWIKDRPDKVLDVIELVITDKCPGIEELKGSLWLPEHLMVQEKCTCTNWVWGVLWNYERKGYIKVPTEEVLIDKLSNRMNKIQPDQAQNM